MHRDVARMAGAEHDIIVVGGGIHGTCAAWEAARRGLRVALVEAADFGSATSANSLRTFHGGIRYLQQLDFRRMRESIRERREWLRLAPDLVQPMRFVLPTSGHGMRGPQALAAALLANDLVSADRNEGVRPDRQLPPGELWSAARARRALDGTAMPEFNGAAAWYDAICLNTERLQIGVVSAAACAGAQVANYARALDLRSDSNGVRGARVRDELTGAELELRARVVINAAGPWVDEWLTSRGAHLHQSLFTASKAFNLLTRPLPFTDALALPCASTYFAIPWNGRTLIGTRHLRCGPSTTVASVSTEEVQSFLHEVNGVLGKHRIAASDVTGVFSGLLPERDDNTGNEVALSKTARVVDHQVTDGTPGLYSIVGIKWTTARAVAERAVRMACARLGTSPERATQRRLNLGIDGPGAAAVHELIAQNPSLSERIVPDMPIMKAQVIHAGRAELAFRLWDVVRRRVPLYLSDALDARSLHTCATLLERELGWTKQETSRQIEETVTQLQEFRGVADRARFRANFFRPLAEQAGTLSLSSAGSF